jgi:uncharacterized protein (TIGR00369 family)
MSDCHEITLTIAQIQKAFQDHPFTQWLNFVPLEIEAGRVKAMMRVEARHIALNGFLYAPVVMALGDLVAGIGTVSTLAGFDSGQNFATLEIKSNFMRTVRTGIIYCVATARHLGRQTQVWDGEISDEQGHLLCLFRNTQLLLERK